MTPDRHLRIENGRVVKTAYVPVFECRLACRERMSVGDVDRAFQKLLQHGSDSPWPCPNGHWTQDAHRRVFVIEDGRHEWLAAVMLGKTHLLVAWTEDASSVLLV